MRATPWRALSGRALGVLSFAWLILVINPIQIASALLYPFSPGAFRAVNRRCAQAIGGFWVWMAERRNRIHIRVTGDALPVGENALLIANHQSVADVMVLMCLGDRCGRLPDMKWFVKDIVKYLPGPGWGMLCLECIFVKRDWARDEAEISRLFGRYAEADLPVLVVSFLEGTRWSPKKAASAARFASSRGLPVPAHTLVPRTRGFVATLQGLGDHLEAVYDVTIGYPGRVPSMMDCFACRVARIELRVKRTPIGELPEGAEARARWAAARFEEKEALLAGLHAGSPFPGEEVMSRR